MNKRKIEEEAVQWFACNKEGFTPNRKKEFEKWLIKDTKHNKAYECLNKIERLCKSMDDKYLQDLINETEKGVKKTKLKEQIKIYAIAASFFFLIFFGVLQSYNYYFKPNYQNILITKIEPEKVLLPDNSKLTIDAKTNLDIKFFNNERVVTLNYGRVMFKIAKDKQRPFYIYSQNTQIKVVGTAFEVENTDKQITIKVKEGIVKVSKINPENKRIQTLTLIREGEQINLNENSKVIEIKPISTETIARWQNSYLFFDNTSIKNAIKEFSRYTNNKIILNNSDIENLPITGQFSIKQFDSFLNALVNIYSVKIKKETNLISIN